VAMQDVSVDGFGELQVRYLVKCDCAGKVFRPNSPKPTACSQCRCGSATMHQPVHLREVSGG
jgi:hypothetical protein